MTSPQESSENVESLAHSSGEPDPQRNGEDEGSDVGGQAETTESTAERHLDDTSTVAEDDSPDSQVRNPL